MPLDPPVASKITARCFGCGVVIAPEPGSPDSPANQAAYDGGLVHDVWGGYGSRHDCDGFVIAICDKCIDAAVADGRLIQFASL